MKRLLFLLICLLSSPLPSFNLNQHKQVLLVIADDWGCGTAKMWRCRRSNTHSNWEVQNDPFHVRLAPKGLAWARGIHPSKDLIGPRKREDDKRSLSGIFPIGPVIGMGAKDEIDPLDMPYIHITPSLVAINDIQSSYYNRIVDSTLTEGDWNSSINMSSCKSCNWGAIIEYNHNPAIPPEGSGTFLMEDTDDPLMSEYVYSALKEQELLEVLYWLRQIDNPIIVQLTKKNYLKFKDKWQLPDLEWIK